MKAVIFRWPSVSTIFTMLLMLCSSAESQQRIPRMGYLSGASLSAIPKRIEAFQQGLRELGYVEGKNIVIEWRWAEGIPNRLPDLAAELVRLKVDIIVSAGPAVTPRLQEATKTIPIVMAQDNDPVRNGFVASLARPGGNITGLATIAPELSGKQLGLLEEIIPKLSSVAVLGSSIESGNAQTLKEIEIAAGAKVKIQNFDVLGVKDIETAFRSARIGGAAAVLVLVSTVFNSHRTQVVELAINNQLPAIFYSGEYADLGGLMAYGASYIDLYRRAATYVDKILKGAKPADLPVEQPTKFELVINLKTAKQIGLTIPPSVLARADRVIK
jgi:putative tryptophan/tyrosine transport system substrate-binding protein